MSRGQKGNATPDRLKAGAIAAIDRASDGLREIAHFLYDQPETAWVEYQAVGRLCAFLDQRGFQVERGVGGIETAFRATLDSGRPGPTVALLAEYDALVEVGHGCGHNLIAAGALGAAVGLQAVAHDLAGKIVALGTPAEEFTPEPQGKIKLLGAGVFEGVDVSLMFHPWITSAPINSSLATIALDIEFHGQTAHAAADPWNGRNALDGILLTFNHIGALRQHVRPDVRMHGVITDGGVVPNIIPERAAARFLLRASRIEQARDVLARVEACAQGAAGATGTTVDTRVLRESVDTHPYPALQALTRANFELLGAPFGSPVDWTASTDFGNVSHTMPAESFFIDLGAGSLRWHSRDVADATVQEPALESMIAGAKVLAMNAIDIMTDPDVVRRSRLEMPA